MLAVGAKLTHRYFSSNEWVMLEGNKFIFEDGVKISQADFWDNRNGSGWETDWSVFKDLE